MRGIPQNWQEFLDNDAKRRSEQHLQRELRTVRHLKGARIQIGHNELINFCSNDYLGLSSDIRIAEAAAASAGRHGWGVGASRLVSGTTMVHQKLESEIARFRAEKAALLFGSGYQANLGVISGLVGKGDVVFSDAGNHASVIAGCKLSGAKTVVFDHRDYDSLERKLNSHKGRRRLVVSDGIFSITGEHADLGRLANLAARHDALLAIDDAHANGVLGKNGRGLPEAQNVQNSIPIYIGTFSKTLGSYGGFVTCPPKIREHLVNNSRPFIYTTALPTPVAAANLEALRLLRKEGDGLRRKLSAHVRLLRTKLEAAEFDITGEHHIIGVRVGDPDRVLQMAEICQERGVMIYGMRWPSVPKGEEMLRLSVSAAHSEDDLYRVVQVLKAAKQKLDGKDTGSISRRMNKRPSSHTSLSAVSEGDLLTGPANSIPGSSGRLNVLDRFEFDEIEEVTETATGIVDPMDLAEPPSLDTSSGTGHTSLFDRSKFETLTSAKDADHEPTVVEATEEPKAEQATDADAESVDAKESEADVPDEDAQSPDPDETDSVETEEAKAESKDDSEGEGELKDHEANEGESDEARAEVESAEEKTTEVKSDEESSVSTTEAKGDDKESGDAQAKADPDDGPEKKSEEADEDAKSKDVEAKSHSGSKDKPTKKSPSAKGKTQRTKRKRKTKKHKTRAKAKK